MIINFKEAAALLKCPRCRNSIIRFKFEIGVPWIHCFNCDTDLVIRDNGKIEVDHGE